MGLAAELEKLREITYTEFTSEDDWIRLGLPFLHPVRLFAIKSTMDADVYISKNLYIGEQIRIPEYGYDTYDISTNNSEKQDIITFPENTQLWIKKVSATPSRGHVWVTTMYVERY